jgi:hypothetical protein
LTLIVLFIFIAAVSEKRRKDAEEAEKRHEAEMNHVEVVTVPAHHPA